jgi:hypothetical protein
MTSNVGGVGNVHILDWCYPVEDPAEAWTWRPVFPRAPWRPWRSRIIGHPPTSLLVELHAERWLTYNFTHYLCLTSALDAALAGRQVSRQLNWLGKKPRAYRRSMAA